MASFGLRGAQRERTARRAATGEADRQRRRLRALAPNTDARVKRAGDVDALRLSFMARAEL